MTGGEPPASEEPSRAEGAWLLFLLMLAYTSSYLDRSILGVLQEPIKGELGLTDGELGLLGGFSFAIFYTTLGIPLARLAERYRRTTIISICLVAWSSMTALCGVAQSYVQLLLCRIGVGVGEAGCHPASHSLITDIFPPERRASALSIYTLGAPLGALAGGVIGGAVAQTWGWRTAFIAVGAPGLLLALLLMVTVKEPPRGFSEGRPASAAGPVPSLRSVVGLLFKSSVFRHLAIALSLVVVVGFGGALFMSPFFLRNFDLTLAEVGLVFGAVNGVGAAAGTLARGFLSDWSGKRDRRFYAWVPGLCLAAAGPLFVTAFMQTGWLAATILLMLAMSLIYTATPAGFAIVHNMVEPRMRATAAAILFLITNLVGAGFGPPLLGFASDYFAASAFASAQAGSFAALCPSGVSPPGAGADLELACRSASGTGMRYALILSGLMCLWAAAHLGIVGARLKGQTRSEQRDEAARSTA